MIVFGRVPFFFYVIHLYVIHALAMLLLVVQGRACRSTSCQPEHHIRNIEQLWAGIGSGLCNLDCDCHIVISGLQMVSNVSRRGIHQNGG